METTAETNIADKEIRRRIRNGAKPVCLCTTANYDVENILPTTFEVQLEQSLRCVCAWGYIEYVDTIPVEICIGVASYGAVGHVPPLPPTFYFFQFTLELHKVWRRLCAVASPNICSLYYYGRSMQ